MPLTARRVAFKILKSVAAGAYADVALQRCLSPDLAPLDRKLVTELAYGVIRRQRTLDTLISRFAKKPADKQPPELRWILQLGLYQLRYLDQIPQAAAIHSTVELSKEMKLGGLSKVVNGILRQYQRQAQKSDPLQLPDWVVSKLGVQHSYPDWMIEVWLQQIGADETAQLCDWMSRNPKIDLRINTLKTTQDAVQASLAAKDIKTASIPGLVNALRFESRPGKMSDLPGFKEGHWMVQDASAQLVSHLVDPKPDEVILDLCAAPGGKTLHLASLMGDRGKIWACDPTKSRLKKIQQNIDRMGIQSVSLVQGDGRQISEQIQEVDAVLIDAPCSGLGTLHRHADARWRQTPDSVKELSTLQLELLAAAAQRLKTGGRMIYSTCTLHPSENEQAVAKFLADYPNFVLDAVDPEHPVYNYQGAQPGTYKVWPHRNDMDGFYMARFKKLDAN